MIKWTFDLKDRSIVVCASEKDDLDFQNSFMNSWEGNSLFIYTKLENGQDCFFNLQRVVMALREVIEEPATESRVVENPQMTEQEIKDTYGSVPDVV